MSPRRSRLVAGAIVAALAVPSAVLMSTADAASPTSTSVRASDETAPTTATATATATVTTTATATPTETADGPVTVDDAQLRWSLNDESNRAAFAPGTFNFLSAGEIGNPGAGGQTIPACRTGETCAGATWSNGKPSRWAARSGEVRIEKRTSAGTYAAATFAGTATDANGTRLTTSSSASSGHQVVIDGGTGEIDPEQGTATVSWKGTFTVLYYSGMTFFMVTDPQLVVTPTTARLMGTLSGYASDMNDTSRWQKVPGQKVVLADLPRADLELPTEGGFTATPAYAEVTYDAPASGVAQVRTGETWGAFPASYLAYMQKVGAAAYWYSSGGSADPHKVAEPITVSYSAGDPVEVPVDPDPTDDPSGDPTQTPTQSVAPPPPTPTPTPTPTPAQPAGPAVPSQPAVAVPPGTTPQAISSPLTYDPRLPTVPVVTAETAPAASPADPSGHPWEWWTGSVLLLGAAVITTIGRLGGRRKGQS